MFWLYQPERESHVCYLIPACPEKDQKFPSKLCHTCLGNFLEILSWCVCVKWDETCYAQIEEKTIPGSRNVRYTAGPPLYTPLLVADITNQSCTLFQKPCIQQLPTDRRAGPQDKKDFLPLLGKEGYALKSIGMSPSPYPFPEISSVLQIPFSQRFGIEEG